ncbi:Glycosyltransferase involved in cell wall bisynthesis [Lutibacter oricola]|uniref:Glycosyltransferase involved in cell wall bisynthesis n=1 Tax=Lutibacter oricola TaxID=762486 RepID=A0A1H3FQV1_9FLAO|nr:glycosyltransferase family 4 protein [Lutibacter oricola]SDX93167.1 Glycosyltransferase involved in cell wall bisynthesis [Lutibacter oricola]
MHIVFSSNISWSIYNFRTPLLKSLKAEGHKISTVAFKDAYASKLIEEGFNFYEININNNATNPLEDLKTIAAYYKLYKKIKPDVICHNAIKPNIYGTIAAGLLKIPTVNNISGLGTLFIKKSFSTYLAKVLYKISQKKASLVFFQNSDDFNLFTTSNIVKKEKCRIIPGSGVDTTVFISKEGVSKNSNNFEFLFIGRLLYDKGIREYVTAAKNIKKRYPNAVFNILGPLYAKNATAVTKETLDAWVENSVVNYLGETDNVKEFMQVTNCVVLPSYREGLSKVLIEASSIGVPIITTNVPGCRDVVVDNVTGFLCKVKDSKDLELKMEKMLLASDKERSIMGVNARKRAINTFDINIIINHYKNAINDVTSTN